MHTFLPKLGLLLLLALTVGTLQLQAQSMVIKDPVKYNDYIVEQQNLIGEQLLSLIDMFSDLPEDKAVITSHLDKLINTCGTAVNKVKNLKTIPNEFGMKQAAIELFSFYKVTMDTDYRALIDEFYKAMPDGDAMQDIIARIEAAEAPLDESFQGKQGQFAKYHNIMLLENELEKELQDAGEGN
jgi:hypothetical protein